MAVAIEEDEVELDQETEIVDEQLSVDAPVVDESAEPEGESEEAEQTEEEEVSITLGDEPVEPEEPKAFNPNLPNHLRKVAREKDKVIRELQAQLKALSPENKPVELGAEPDMADEDVNWDTDKFKAKFLAWTERKRAIEAEAIKARKAQEDADREWAQLHENYAKAKTALKVRDFEDSEDVVKQHFSEHQQALILAGATRPAELVYAIGRHPEEAERLAKITNNVRFAVELGKLEAKLKVTPKVAPPAPEKGVPRTAGGGAAVNSKSAYERELARLEKLFDEGRIDRTLIRKLNERWREQQSRR